MHKIQIGYARVPFSLLLLVIIRIINPFHKHLPVIHLVSQRIFQKPFDFCTYPPHSIPLQQDRHIYQFDSNQRISQASSSESDPTKSSWYVHCLHGTDAPHSFPHTCLQFHQKTLPASAQYSAMSEKKNATGANVNPPLDIFSERI